MVDSTHAVFAGYLIKLLNKSHSAQFLAIQANRYSSLKTNLYILRLIGSSRRRFSPGENLLRRFDPGVFQHAALDAPAPEVLIYGVRAGNFNRYRDAVLFSVG